MRLLAMLRRIVLNRCGGYRYVPGDIGRPTVLWCSLLPRHNGEHVAQDLQRPDVIRYWS